MIDGLYSVTFTTPQGEFGGGVVFFTSGKVKGGDQSYFYDGTAQTDGDTLLADIKVRRYQDAGESVFGPLREFRVRLTGLANGPRFVLSGRMVENPSAPITVRCAKLADA